MTALLISIVIAPLIGFLVICCLWPNRTAFKRYLLTISFLAVGLGFGLCSVLFFFWLLVRGEPGYGFFIVEGAVLAFLIAGLFYKLKARTGVIAGNGNRPLVTRSRLSVFLRIAVFVAMISAAVSYANSYKQSPHGQGDAVSVWNMRARFIFRGGAHWREGVSTLLSHPDYPLLLPLTVARSWQFAGSDSTNAPALIAFLFTFATIGLVASSLSVLHTTGQGLLAALLLLGTPFLIRHGASQYADVPMAFFLLATVVLFCLNDALGDKSHKLIVLAGAAAGFSAWTKNEGWLFLVSIIAARFITFLLSRDLRGFFREIISFSAGLLFPLIAILIFKTKLSPANDLLSGQGFQPTHERLSSLSRYVVVAKAFFNEALGFGGWWLGPAFLLALYPLVLGIRIQDRNRKGVITSFSAICIMLVGYFFIYVTTPEDLAWHLNTSLNRLLLQIWPIFVFTYFLVIKGPEEATQQGESATRTLTSSELPTR